MIISIIVMFIARYGNYHDSNLNDEKQNLIHVSYVRNVIPNLNKAIVE